MISKSILNNWKQKEEIQKTIYPTIDTWQREKQIYYDTDRILEKQIRHFSQCPHCSGYESTDSTSSTGYHILAITNPKECLFFMPRKKPTIFIRTHRLCLLIYISKIEYMMSIYIGIINKTLFYLKTY